VNPYAASGRLALPLHSRPETIALHFALMPASAGHRFEVRNVRLIPGQRKGDDPDPDRRGPIDLTGGRLRQTGCATPIGCAHPSVSLKPSVFASVMPGAKLPTPTDNPGQPAPSDDPNQPPSDHPPKPPGRLSLELPVDRSGRSARSLHFAYRLSTAGAQDGAAIVITATGRTVVEAVIAAPGSGLASVELPRSSLPIDSVTFAFVRGGGVGPAGFEIRDVAVGPRAPRGAGALPIEELTTCESCDPPASRLDPCGPFLATFWVEAADSREGRGIRCLSNDGLAWYGEGWWVDPDYGRYRHLGYATGRDALGLPDEALAVDFGVTRVVEAGLATYGVAGPQILRIDRIGLFRWHVFTASRSWDEIWQFVPKSTPLPAFFGTLPWDKSCGSFGLHAWEAADLHFGQRRCTMPSNLAADPSDVAHTSLPLVWYGESYLNHRRFVLVPERTHLGWLGAAPEPPSPVGFYVAADRCALAPLEAPCASFDLVTIEVLGPGASSYPSGTPQGALEDGAFHDRQGLYVTGPDTWRDGRGDGDAWMRLLSLPGAAALAPPTPICVEASCP
jgi:hypothetical protein